MKVGIAMLDKDYLPNADSGLLSWGTAYSAKLTATPLVFGVTAPIASALAALVASYSTKLAVATDPATRTRSNIATKDEAKKLLKANIRETERITNAFPGTTNAMRLELGLTPRSGTVTPINPPTEAPVMRLISAMGRTMRFSVSGTDTTRRGRIKGASQVFLFSYVGSSPNPDVTKWVFEGATSKVNNIEITFAPSVPAGAQVWLCATWSTARGLNGPACTPISAYIAGGVSMAEAA